MVRWAWVLFCLEYLLDQAFKQWFVHKLQNSGSLQTWLHWIFSRKSFQRLGSIVALNRTYWTHILSWRCGIVAPWLASRGDLREFKSCSMKPANVWLFSSCAIASSHLWHTWQQQSLASSSPILHGWAEKKKQHVPFLKPSLTAAAQRTSSRDRNVDHPQN